MKLEVGDLMIYIRMKKDLIIMTKYYLIIDVPVAVRHQLINMNLGQFLI